MRAVLQRVTDAQVTIADEVVSKINQGFMILLGAAEGDSDEDASYLAGKTANLRVFTDDDGKMNRSILDIQGQALVVSQFTLLGDCRKGRRPSFIDAQSPEQANENYLRYCQHLENHGVVVKKGVFAADMQVSLTNDGPVTILLDSRKLF